MTLAVEMGWARSYDAEHCALAESVDGRLITCDMRLRRGAEGRLPYVVTPDEIIEAHQVAARKVTNSAIESEGTSRPP